MDLVQEVKCKKCGALYQVENFPINITCLCKNTEFSKCE